MNKFIRQLILFVVGFVSLVGAQGVGNTSVLRITQENLLSFHSELVCHEVNPLPPIAGVTGPLYSGFYRIVVNVNEERLTMGWFAKSNPDLTWSEGQPPKKKAAYRTCEKAKAEAEKLDWNGLSYLELFQKVKNADITLVTENTVPPVTYCRISQADLYFYPDLPNSIHTVAEVYKLVPCP